MSNQTFLVPVDGSDQSIKAAKYAIKMGKLMDAELLVFHCHKPFPVTLGEPYFQKAIDKMQIKVSSLLDPFRTLFNDSGIKFAERVLEGQPGAMICEAAKIEKCEMIIMGSRGRSELKGLFLGSVTHRVLHSAPCPVLVVR